MSATLRRLLPSVIVGLVALTLAGCFAAIRYDRLGGAHTFVLAGTDYADPAAVSPEVLPLTPGGGYDGQFVYRLSYAPLTTHARGHGIILDTPTYRQGRILLPVVVWAAHSVLPLSRADTIIVVNVLAIGLAGLGGALVARALGRHELFGLVVALQPGVVVGLARDINEPLQWALLMCGLALWLRERWWAAAPLFALAALARETAVFVVAGLGLAVVVQALQHKSIKMVRHELAALLLTPLALGGWELYLKTQWHGLPSANSGTSFGPPFSGALHSLWRGFTHPTSYYTDNPTTQSIWNAQRVQLLVLIAIAAYLLVRGGVPLAVRMGCLLPLIAALSLHSWAYDSQFQRAALEASGMGAVVLLAAKPRWAQWVAVLVPGILIALAYELTTNP